MSVTSLQQVSSNGPVGTDLYNDPSSKLKPAAAPSQEKVFSAYQSPSAPILLAQVTNVKPVEKAPSADEVVAVKQYLLMLGEIRSLGYLKGWRNIQYAVNFDDYGNVPKGEATGGWPAGKSVKDVMKEGAVSALKLLSYVKDNMLSAYDKVKSSPSAKTEFAKFLMVYDHFASEIFLPFDDMVSGFDLFGRLNNLNSKLPAGSRLSNTGKMSESTFDPPEVLKEMGTLSRSKASFSPEQREALNEMIVICTLATVKYMRGLRAVQNANNIDEYGKGWPSGKSFRDLLNGNAEVKSNIKQNIAAVYGKTTSRNEFDRFVMTYDHYGNAFAGFYDLIGFDPVAKMRDINDRLLCGKAKLDSVNARDFDELSFLREVKLKVTYENINTCYGPQVSEFAWESNVPWEKLKPIWADYIVRVYASMGVNLESVKGKGSKSGTDTLDMLLEEGHLKSSSKRSTGITAADVEVLTKAVEFTKTGTEMSHSHYLDKALIIHGDSTSVPDGLKSENLGILSVFYKMDANGIRVKGIKAPLGQRVSSPL